MPLPQNHEFLAGVQPSSIDNRGGLSMAERALLLALVRLFFGPAQAAGAVCDVSEPNSLRDVGRIIRQPGERFERLVQQTSLPADFFDHAFVRPSEPRLFVARQEHGEEPPAYFVFESGENIVMYIGADFLHGHPEELVINCLVLDSQFGPKASHTLRL